MSADMPLLLMINGTSSTGKTTLARALQAAWPTPMMYLGLDAWITMNLAQRYWEPATTIDAIKTDSYVRQGTHFLAPGSPDNPGPWPKIGSGPVADQCVYAMHDTAIAFMAKGIDVVLDCVLLKDAWRDDFLQKTAQLPRYLIQMTAPDQVLAQREQTRGNRMENVFRSLLPIVHQDMCYDIRIDSHQLSTQQAVQHILMQLALRHKP